MRRHRLIVVCGAVMLATTLAPAPARAQRGGGPPPPPQGPAQARAPIDLTGVWVSVVTEDWKWRMVTPAKGDYARVPLNPDGRKVADTWDMAKDAAAGEQCRPFGVGGLMRMPTRLRIAWQDPEALTIESDAGTQTRLLRFVAAAQSATGEARTLQGSSAAQWEFVNAREPAQGGSLKVVTTRMRAGYLRKNGVPYSENMVLTEHFDRHNEPNGDQWFTVTSIVEDPMYLTGPFVTTTHFKKEADGSKWRPTGCDITPPVQKP